MISILHIEDNELDHRLVCARLKDENLDFSIIRIETEQEMRQALERETFDLILADYNLPAFNGAQALAIARAMRPGIPVIIVSGAVREQAAVELLHSGANDYILKDHLGRLPLVVRRALADSADQLARREAEAEIRRSRDLAEAANRAKDRFLAVLSHELRTPLTPVLSAVQMLEADASLPPDLHDQIRMIRRNVELEVQLIDDLLDLTRVSQGKLELHLQPTDIHDKLRHVLSICSAEFRTKGLTITTVFEAKNHYVMCDPPRMLQVLWNLLKNAAKFTGEGGRITVRTADVPGNRVELSITDTGIGIESSKLTSIFDAFEQGGKEVTRQFGGLGLGLAITRAIIEQHQGHIAATSDGLGCGSTFSVVLPTTTQHDIHFRAHRPAGPDKSSMQNCNVLLVEDHSDTAYAMERILKSWGCHVQIANSVAHALQDADALPFDLVISDIGLPDGTGFDLIRQILARHPIKGIALSGFGMDEDIRQSREAGFSEHLIKPVDLHQLEAAIKRVLAAPVAEQTQPSSAASN
jgi:signal transduction histidine kinase